MSGQQSMFVDPEHQNSEQRMYNHDPREQEGYAEGSYQYGGETYYQGPRQQEKIQPQTPRRRSFLPLLILLIMLATFVFGVFSYQATRPGGLNGQKEIAASQYQTNVAAGTKIVIVDNSGDVHVHTGSANTVFAQESGGAKNNPFKLFQNAGVLMVTVHDDGGLFGNSNSNLDITVPQGSDLQVTTNSGDIELDSTTASVQATSSSGNIHAQSLGGPNSILHSNSGSITVDAMEGTAQVSTDNGDVSIDQANLKDSSSIATNSGSITYHGTLSATGSYRFSTSSGDVNLNLTGDSGVQVETHTSSGDVHNEFATGPGNVQISTNSGDIKVQKA